MMTSLWYRTARQKHFHGTYQWATSNPGSPAKMALLSSWMRKNRAANLKSKLSWWNISAKGVEQNYTAHLELLPCITQLHDESISALVGKNVSQSCVVRLSSTTSHECVLGSQISVRAATKQLFTNPLEEWSINNVFYQSSLIFYLQRVRYKVENMQKYKKEKVGKRRNGWCWWLLIAQVVLRRTVVTFRFCAGTWTISELREPQPYGG